MRRVLKPGGELRFLEHVRAEQPLKARVQRLFDRSGIWPLVGGGCHCSRDRPSGDREYGLHGEEGRKLQPRTVLGDHQSSRARLSSRSRLSDASSSRSAATSRSSRPIRSDRSRVPGSGASCAPGAEASRPSAAAGAGAPPFSPPSSCVKRSSFCPGGVQAGRRSRARPVLRAPARPRRATRAATIRSVRLLSSPGVCGPRRRSTASTASCSRPRPSASSARWRYLIARLPWPLASRARPYRDSRWAASRTCRLVVVGDRVAVGRLVAGQTQRVERQRILLGGREALLDQAPEHSLLRSRQLRMCTSARILSEAIRPRARPSIQDDSPTTTHIASPPRRWQRPWPPPPAAPPPRQPLPHRRSKPVAAKPVVHKQGPARSQASRRTQGSAEARPDDHAVSSSAHDHTGRVPAADDPRPAAPQTTPAAPPATTTTPPRAESHRVQTPATATATTTADLRTATGTSERRREPLSPRSEACAEVTSQPRSLCDQAHPPHVAA